MKSRTPLTVEVFRGPVVESSHNVMSVIVDHRARLIGFCGNVDYVTFPRSSIKMLQAIPFVESGAMEKFGLDESMLALACSSHRGEKQHLEIAAKWMEKLKLTDTAFHCGPEYPAHVATQHDMIRKGVPPQRVCHNCSGKHLGFMSTALALGENPAGYANWDHPVQVRLRKLMTELTKIDHEKTPSGVDGCGIPTYSVPLEKLANAMAHLVSEPTSQVRKATLKRILDACRRYPQLIAGSDDFVSLANEKTNGRVILKSGAEGVYAALSPEHGQALIVKAHDGSKRAAEVAVGFMLRQMKWITDKEAADLLSFLVPVIKNSRGEKTGEIRVHKGH